MLYLESRRTLESADNFCETPHEMHCRAVVQIWGDHLDADRMPVPCHPHRRDRCRKVVE